MHEQIKKIIEEDINPQLELHAGGCELIDVEEGIVTLRLFGAVLAVLAHRLPFLMVSYPS